MLKMFTQLPHFTRFSNLKKYLHSSCTFQRFSSTSFNRWLVCFLIGVFTACTAVVVDIGIERLSEVKLDLVRKCKF